jgi:hypothetical protein
MAKMKYISLLLFLLIAITACKSDIKHQLQKYHPSSESSSRTAEEGTTMSQSYPLDSTLQHQQSNSVVYGPSHSSSRYDRSSPYDYAEKKTTDELEDEYYNVYGNDIFDHMDEEEYEAAEYYDPDEDYDD